MVFKSPIYKDSYVPYRETPVRTKTKVQYCTKCGKNLLADYHYCPQCGTSVELRDRPNECECGATFGAEDKFCHACGKEIKRKK